MPNPAADMRSVYPGWWMDPQGKLYPLETSHEEFANNYLKRSPTEPGANEALYGQGWVRVVIGPWKNSSGGQTMWVTYGNKGLGHRQRDAVIELADDKASVNRIRDKMDRMIWERPAGPKMEDSYPKGHFSSKQAVHLKPGQATILLADLPDDMQQLLVDYFGFGSGAKEPPAELPLKEIPLASFPNDLMVGSADSRGTVHARGMVGKNNLPPVIMADGHFLDGQHRVWAARKEGKKSIMAIDLSGMGLQSQTNSLGKLRESKDQIYKAFRDPKIAEILSDTHGVGPFDGGCLLCAKALQLVLGGDLVYLASPSGQAEHYGLQTSRGFSDASGSYATAEQWIDAFSRQEQIKFPLAVKQGLPEIRDPLDALDDPGTVKDLAKVLARHLPMSESLPNPNKLGESVTDTPEFKRWFGNSKVVDANGRPLVVYHGTDADFTLFDPAKGRSPQIYFTDQEGASGYGTKTVPVFLSLRNPAEHDFKGRYWNDFNPPSGRYAIYRGDELVKSKGFFDSEFEANEEVGPGEVADVAPEPETTNSLAEIAKETGHDGVIFRNVRDDSAESTTDEPRDVYVAFHPEQIKSAVGNSGAFDPSKPEIGEALPDLPDPRLSEDKKPKGCLMFPIPFRDGAKFIKWTRENIPDEALAEDGIETEVHVTVLWGFDEKVTEKDVKSVCDDYMKKLGRTSLAIQLGEMSLFKSEKYDVLKIGLEECDDLKGLNAHLVDRFGSKVEQTYAYNAHLTLAYVRKGCADDFEGNGKFKGDIFQSDHLVYSFPDSLRKVEIMLGPKEVDESLPDSKTESRFRSKNRHVPKEFKIDPEFGCLTHAEQLVKLNPRLKYVEGMTRLHAKDPWGAHAWAETPRGEIVDPYFEWKFAGRPIQYRHTETSPFDESTNSTINWDRRGYGSIPFQVDIDYFGFEHPMLPAEFRALVPAGVSGPKTKEFMVAAMRKGEAIAAPYLSVQWDAQRKAWQVLDHEGRSRADAATEIAPNQPMPVAIKPRQGRARDLTPEQVAAPFIPQVSESVIKEDMKIKEDLPHDGLPDLPYDGPEGDLRQLVADTLGLDVNSKVITDVLSIIEENNLDMNGGPELKERTIQQAWHILVQDWHAEDSEDGVRESKFRQQADTLFEAHSGPSEIIFIRHGEKDKPEVGPDLNARGWDRAKGLAHLFTHDHRVLRYGKPVAIYACQSDSSIRPIETVEPTARALGVQITHWARDDLKGLVSTIMSNQALHHHSVIVCWAHHQLPVLLKEFGWGTGPSEYSTYDRLWILNFKHGHAVHFKDLPENLLKGDSDRKGLWPDHAQSEEPAPKAEAPGVLEPAFHESNPQRYRKPIYPEWPPSEERKGINNLNIKMLPDNQVGVYGPNHRLMGVFDEYEDAVAFARLTKDFNGFTWDELHASHHESIEETFHNPWGKPKSKAKNIKPRTPKTIRDEMHKELQKSKPKPKKKEESAWGVSQVPDPGIKVPLDEYFIKQAMDSLGK